MVQLTYHVEPLEQVRVFEHRASGSVLKMEHSHEWKSEGSVKSLATLLTGRDHTKLRESIEVVDKDGLRLYYLEKL